MLPLTLESAFPEEAGFVTAGALLIPEDLDGALPAFLGGISENILLHNMFSVSSQRATSRKLLNHLVRVLQAQCRAMHDMMPQRLVATS